MNEMIFYDFAGTDSIKQSNYLMLSFG